MKIDIISSFVRIILFNGITGGFNYDNNNDSGGGGGGGDRGGDKCIISVCGAIVWFNDYNIVKCISSVLSVVCFRCKYINVRACVRACAQGNSKLMCIPCYFFFVCSQLLSL